MLQLSMSVQQFRRPTSRWGYFVLPLLVLAIMCLCRANSPTDLLDARVTWVKSGEYSVAGVTADGALDLVAAGEGSNRQLRSFLLGVSLADTRSAVAHLRSASLGRTVRIQLDRRRINDEGMLQAYVWVEDLLLNEELVRLGLATDDTHPSDSGPIVRRIKKAEQEARKQLRGVWAD